MTPYPLGTAVMYIEGICMYIEVLEITYITSKSNVNPMRLYVIKNKWCRIEFFLGGGVGG